MNWTFKGNAIKLSKPDTALVGRYVLERPKVYYNDRTQKYVMYMHLDGRIRHSTKPYAFASVGVAVSNNPKDLYVCKSVSPTG